MWCKLFLVVLLATALAQSSVLPNNPDQLDSYEVAEVLTGVFHKFKAIIEKAIEKTKNFIHHLERTLHKKTSEIGANLKRKLQEEVDKLLNEFKKLEYEAKKKGIDISVCAKNKINIILNFPLHIGAQIGKCVEDELNKGLSVLRIVSTAVEKSIVEVRTITGEYKHCRSKRIFKRIACYTRLTAKMSAAVMRIPPALVKFGLRAATFIHRVEPDLIDCGLSKVEQVPKEGQALINEIAQCIEHQTHLNEKKLSP